MDDTYTAIFSFTLFAWRALIGVHCPYKIHSVFTYQRLSRVTTTTTSVHRRIFVYLKENAKNKYENYKFLNIQFCKYTESDSLKCYCGLEGKHAFKNTLILNCEIRVNKTKPV